jgi:hypothetical protein
MHVYTPQGDRRTSTGTAELHRSPEIKKSHLIARWLSSLTVLRLFVQDGQDHS